MGGRTRAFAVYLPSLITKMAQRNRVGPFFLSIPFFRQAKGITPQRLSSYRRRGSLLFSDIICLRAAYSTSLCRRNLGREYLSSAVGESGSSETLVAASVTAERVERGGGGSVRRGKSAGAVTSASAWNARQPQPAGREQCASLQGLSLLLHCVRDFRSDGCSPDGGGGHRCGRSVLNDGL